MSQSATPAKQNNMTTCVATFEKKRFCSFLHRHGDATGKPETRDETRRQEHQTEHFVRDFRQFAQFATCDKERFAASPIDTAKPQANQRLQTRHVGASKRARRARLPPILTLCIKIDVFLRVFSRARNFATSKLMFRARLPSIFSTCHKMPRLPRNLHLVAT